MEDYEKTLEQSALKAKSQWRLPSLQLVTKTIFLNDHYSWIWQPSTVAIAIMSVLFLGVIEQYVSPEFVLPVALWLPNVILYWCLALGFLLLDTLSNEKGKLFKSRTVVPVVKIMKVVMRNHVFTLLLGPPAVYVTFQLFGNGKSTSTREETFTWLIWSIFVHGFIFEIIFWVCHYLEHLSPKLYKDYHLLHHTTKADLAFSGYYMTWIDYCGEALLPLYGCALATAIFGLSPTALLQCVTMHFSQAVVLHSGWNVPGYPHPGEHWLHHTKVAPKGQGINYGTAFNLLDDMMTTKESFDLCSSDKKK